MVNQQQTDIHIIPVTENLAGPTVKKIMNDARSILSNGPVKSCTLDFSKCDFLDSSGIGALVTLSQDFQQHNALLILRNLKNDLFQLFTETGLDRYFSIESAGDIKKASVNLFEKSVDIRLTLQKEIIGSVCILSMSGVMNHPVGSQYFKQQLLLSLTECKLILLDMDELTFFDSLSINAVLSMNSLLKNTGGQMQICGANYIIEDLLKTLCIDVIIPVFKTREEALTVWGVGNG